MDHVHKSTAGKSRLTKAQAEFRGELVKDALAKRREREARLANAKPALAPRTSKP